MNHYYVEEKVDEGKTGAEVEDEVGEGHVLLFYFEKLGWMGVVGGRRESEASRVRLCSEGAFEKVTMFGLGGQFDGGCGGVEAVERGRENAGGANIVAMLIA